MTFDQKQIAAAVALIALGFFLGHEYKRAAVAASGAAAHNDVAGQPEQWWTFPGSWATN